MLAPAVEAVRDDWWRLVWREGATSALVVGERPDVAHALRAEGYAVRLDPDGRAAIDVSFPYDIAVVDVTTTGRSVASLLAPLRARSAMPILVVSPGRSRESLVLDAFAAGGDQVVATGERLQELLARIRALLRRCPPARRGLVALDRDDPRSLTVDLATGTATVAGHTLVLTQREGELLHALLSHPGRVVTREQLAGVRRSAGTNRGLDSLVRGLRNKVEAAEGHRRIAVVRGVGFRLITDVEHLR